jgi:hypothetical protein
MSPLGISVIREFYSSLRVLGGPVLVQTQAVDLLVHDNRVRKFPPESNYYLPSFKKVDKVGGGRRGRGEKSWVK